MQLVKTGLCQSCMGSFLFALGENQPLANFANITIRFDLLRDGVVQLPLDSAPMLHCFLQLTGQLSGHSYDPYPFVETACWMTSFNSSNEKGFAMKANGLPGMLEGSSSAHPDRMITFATPR
jgi:hypothetical protein